MRGRTILSLAILTATVWAVWSGLAAWQYASGRPGSGTVVASFIAAVLCWASASAALLITAATSAGANGLTGLMLAIFCRTGLPLIAAVALHVSVEALAAAGLFGYVLLFYLIALAVETALSVWLIHGSAAGRASSLQALRRRK